jgi:phospholipase C
MRGAAFQVRSGNPSDLPRTYTVEADKSVSDSFGLTTPFAYDLSVSGPHGFLRHFKGDAVAGRANLDLTVRYDRGERDDEATISLAITNRGTSRREVIVTSHYGDRDSETRRLAPGHIFRLSLELKESFGWYDLSVTVDGDQGFLRRLAGHVETGEGSFSDPAIGA